MLRDNGIHPELRRVARFVPRTPVTPNNFRIARRLESLYRLKRTPGAEALTLTTGQGIRLYAPQSPAEPAGALLWIPGGGLIAGRPEQNDDFCVRLVRKLGITIAAPAYRLAPEHKYPAALEDCYAALKWMASLPSVDADRVAIGGESAGGGLAAALAFLSRDRGEITPVLQLLSYPMLDDRTTAAPNANYRMWDERINSFAWTSYLGDAEPAKAVPARRTDLAGLPPAWIGVGTNDLFHQECVAYAERLENAGVACHLEVVRGGFHTFDRLAPRTRVGRDYFGSQCDALRRAFA